MKQLLKFYFNSKKQIKLFFCLLIILSFTAQGCYSIELNSIEFPSILTSTPIKNHHFYVSNTGSNSSKCTLISPCLDYKDAEALATAGDTIHLSGNLDKITITKSGNQTSPITILGENAILSGLIVQANYIQIYNIEITNAISHGILVESKHVLVQDSLVHNSVTENGINGQCALEGDDASWGSGLKIKVGAEHVILRNNVIFNNCGEGIAITRGANILVENNTIGSNYSVGVYIDNSYNVTIKNNKITCDNTYLRNGNPMSGIVLAAEIYANWGMQLHDNIITNNIVNSCYDNIASWETDDESPSINLTIDNNTSINSIRYSIDIDSINENIVVSNNVLDKPVHFDEEEGLVLINNIVQTPSP